MAGNSGAQWLPEISPPARSAGHGTTSGRPSPPGFGLDVSQKLRWALKDLAAAHKRNKNGNGPDLEDLCFFPWVVGEHPEKGCPALTTLGESEACFCADIPTAPLRSFRELSRKYYFGLSPPDKGGLPMGLPGRVYSSARGEMAPDIQWYKGLEGLGADGKRAPMKKTLEYLRRDTAILLGIRTTMALPVFELDQEGSMRGGILGKPVAIMEIDSTTTEVNWNFVVGKLAEALNPWHLSTGDIDNMVMVIPLEQSALWKDTGKAVERRLPQKWEIDIDSLVLDPKPIGIGAFGAVFKAKYKGAAVVCKRLKGDITEIPEEYLQDLIAELLIWSNLHHPNICQFLGAVTIKGCPLTLVATYCENGSLSDLIIKHGMAKTRFPWADAIRFALGTASGMYYLHSHKPNAIMHRDLKPANLLIDGSMNIKIVDFGLSKIAAKELERAPVDVSATAPTMTGRAGTYKYMAPEVFRQENYSKKCDVFSFAIIMYELFEGTLLARARTLAQEIQCIHVYDHLSHAQKIAGAEHWRPPLNGNPIWTNDINRQIQKLIRDCWHREAMGRPEFEQIYARLEALSQEKRIMLVGDLPNPAGRASSKQKADAPGGCGCTIQ